jgi:Zn-dependent protease with chaperone function
MADSPANLAQTAAAVDSAILNAFSGRPRGIRPGPVYLLGLLLTSAAMVLVPLCYLGLVALIGYAVYYHATYDLAHFSAARLSGRAWLAYFAFGYVGPLVIGLITIVFMLKPILARPAKGPDPLALDRSQEPLLYAVIEKLCQVIGAPRPRRILVDCSLNAGAGFGEGIFSIVRRDLTLTLGLPLVENLNVREFVGVLAHEFGHFSQRLGTRLSYVIRSVDAWLARVVYERDQWDATLVQACEEQDKRIAIVLYLARAVIFLTRQVLKIFMFAGHVISCFMLRQMEYNADRYEMEVAGSKAFESTMVRLSALNLVWPGLMLELGAAWREKRLPDNLPRLLRQRVETAGHELEQAARREVEESSTGLFSTHPGASARVHRARQRQCKGIFSGHGPATALFSNFKMIANAVTLSTYRNVYGLAVERGNLVSTDDMVREHERERRMIGALGRYFGDCVSLGRPFLTEGERPGDGQPARALVLSLRKARAEFDEARSQGQTLYRRSSGLATRIGHLTCVHAAVRAGLNVNAAEVDIPEPGLPAIEEALRRARTEKDEVVLRLRPLVSLQRARLMTSLALVRHPEVRSRARLKPERTAELESLLSTAHRMEFIQPLLHRLQQDMETLCWVLGHSPEGEDHRPAALSTVVQELRMQLGAALADLQHALRDEVYPFPFGGRRVTLAEYAIEVMPAPTDLVGLVRAAGIAVGKLRECHVRAMANLAEVAERVELVVGLPKLPDPAPPPGAEGPPGPAGSGTR